MDNRDIFAEYEPKKRNTPKYILAVLIILVIVGAMVAGIFIGLNLNGVTPQTKEMAEDMPTLSKIHSLIKQYYYKDVDWSSLEYSSAEAMANALDPFSDLYLTKSESSNYSYGISFVSTLNNAHYVLRAQPRIDGNPDTPGERVKVENNQIVKTEDTARYALERGDRIVYVNGVYVEGMTSANMITYGFKNELITTVMVQREDVTGDNEYLLFKRMGNIYTPDYARCGTITGSGLPTDSTVDKVFYMAYDGFTQNSGLAFANCMYHFMQSGSNKLILDLRDNGGGAVSVLGEVASYFVPDTDGTQQIMRIRYKDGQESTQYTVPTKYKIPISKNQHVDFDNKYIGDTMNMDDFEMVILTSNRTASASEAMIGILQYYLGDKLTLVGGATYGKGVAQSDFEIDEYTLHMTIGYFDVPFFNGTGKVWVNNHEKPYTPNYDTTQSGNYNVFYPYSEIYKETDVKQALEVLCK